MLDSELHSSSLSLNMQCQNNQSQDDRSLILMIFGFYSRQNPVQHVQETIGPPCYTLAEYAPKLPSSGNPDYTSTF